MKKIKLFYLESCPHCKKAQYILDNLLANSSEYQKLEIERIEEQENAEIASQYDYYYVPTFFVDDSKVHEGAVQSETQIKDILDNALN